MGSGKLRFEARTRNCQRLCRSRCFQELANTVLYDIEPLPAHFIFGERRLDEVEGLLHGNATFVLVDGRLFELDELGPNQRIDGCQERAFLCHARADSFGVRLRDDVLRRREVVEERFDQSAVSLEDLVDDLGSKIEVGRHRRMKQKVEAETVKDYDDGLALLHLRYDLVVDDLAHVANHVRPVDEESRKRVLAPFLGPEKWARKLDSPEDVDEDELDSRGVGVQPRQIRTEAAVHPASVRISLAAYCEPQYALVEKSISVSLHSQSLQGFGWFELCGYPEKDSDILFLSHKMSI